MAKVFILANKKKGLVMGYGHSNPFTVTSRKEADYVRKNTKSAKGYSILSIKV